MSEYNKTVLVDMDGVMADFDNDALKGIPQDLIVPRSHFYVAQDYPEDIQCIIENTYNSPDFFTNLKVMDGLHEGWQTLLDNGYSPRVASAPLTSNKNCIEGKIKWLGKNMVPTFGPSVVSNAIIDKNKWKYPGLAIIDDNPAINRAGHDTTQSAEWEHILFGWAHLTDVPLATTAFRLLSWHDTNELIQMLEIIKELKR